MLFNGVLISRECGFLTPIPSLNSVEIGNCTANALRIDKGDKEVLVNHSTGATTTKPIESNPDNLPLVVTNDVSINTGLYARLNGSLEAGRLAFYGDKIVEVILRRTSNETNFTVWEDIGTFEFKNEFRNVSILDKAIKSGIIYRYSIQPVNDKGERGSMTSFQNVSLVYDDSFLAGENGQQLKLMYNLSIGSYKRNDASVKVDTINGKYPYVIKNAASDYHQFSMSGTITHFMDTKKEFLPEMELFIDSDFVVDSPIENTVEQYEQLNERYGLNDYNNSHLEREFRNKVLDFLQNGKPKLFKSPTEGLMIVQLMNINLTPNQQLGRRIYDFSCEVVEVDKVTMENLRKYGIQGA